MDYQQALSYIHQTPMLSGGDVLLRMKKALNRLGNPQEKLRCIHIAGTNGKGSTAVMSAEILQRAGYRVGLYISPYIVDFRERFQINRTMISEEHFARLVTRLRPIFEELEANGDIMTEFERITVLAFLYFSEEQCDIVCLETGLGGRKDPTNVIDAPLISVITAISLDHTAILGDTVSAIAWEKAGIMKPRSTTVVYPLQDADALAVLMEEAAKQRNTLILPNAAALVRKAKTLSGVSFCYDGREYRLSMAGSYQMYNALTVIEGMKELRRQGYAIPEDAITEGLKKASLPARFEIMHQNPLVILDGGHNRQGGGVLATELKSRGIRPAIAVIGMMCDKDCEGYLAQIAPLCKQIITVTPAVPRAISAQELADIAAEYCDNVRTGELSTVWEEMKRQLNSSDTALISGSLYLAAEIRKQILYEC